MDGERKRDRDREREIHQLTLLGNMRQYSYSEKELFNEEDTGDEDKKFIQTINKTDESDWFIAVSRPSS